MGAQQDLCEIGGVCGFDALAQMKAVEWRWVWKRRWSASMGWGKWGEKDNGPGETSGATRYIKGPSGSTLEMMAFEQSSNW